MRKIITTLLLTGSLAVYAQPKLLTEATIITKTTIVAPEFDDAPGGNFTSENGEQLRVVRFGGDGETKTTTWIKNDLQKTFSESEMGRTTVIRDHRKKLTTTIIEMMGKKTGFYATDAEQEEALKRMDSMMQGRGQNAGFGRDNTPPVYHIVYQDDTKKISGYSCKKALVIGTRSPGRSDTTTVWYTPDFKIQSLSGTGGSAGGFGGFNVTAGKTGFEDLAGFPLQYERTMNRGRTMTVEVTKMIIDKEIKDKEFELPKDIEIKPMKEMQNGGGPGMRIRIGG